MCGIFGALASPKETTARLRPLNSFMKDACVMGLVRGEDSTGIMQVRRYKEEIQQFKLPYNGLLFSKELRAQNLFNNVDCSIITIGHHRAATRGSVSLDNAHPFEHVSDDGKRRVIGVHNGFVSNARTLEDKKSFDVDSDWAMYRIMRDGGQEAIGEMEGHIAFVWWENDGKVRMYSNGKRPIHFGFADDLDAMLFMSEHEMLYALAGRNDISFVDGIYQPSSDKRILVFDPSDLQNYTSEKVKPKAVVVPVTRSVRGPVDNTDYRKNWQGGHGNVVPYLQGGGAHRTPQGYPVMSNEQQLDINFGVRMGKEVRFFLDDRDGEGAIRSPWPNALIGEVLLSKTVSDVECEYAIILDLTPSLKENVIKAAVDNDGEVRCKVVGYTSIDLFGQKFIALALSPPDNLVFSLDKKEAGDDEEPFEPINLDIPGPDGNLVSVSKWLELCKGGCSWCGSPLTIAMARNKQLTWRATDVGHSPLCEECAAYDAEEALHAKGNS